MSALRKGLPVIVVLLVLAAAVAYALRVPIGLTVAARLAASHLGADALASLPDGLHVGLCGTGSPFPDDRRSGPCTLVVAGRRAFVFDAGSGSTRNIGKMGFDHGRIEAIFLTHFHSDHIDGLGELMLQRWVSQGVAGPPQDSLTPTGGGLGAAQPGGRSETNPSPVLVFGPAGVDAVLAGFLQAYAADRDYRVVHHGEATVPPGGFGGIAQPFDTGPSGRLVVLKDADLEIVAFAVDHAPVEPAVGYRISYKGRSVVLSGDTRKSPAVQREAVGVDLLVHEALSPRLVGMLQEAAAKAGRANLRQIFGDIIDYHTTPEEAAETARDAGVGTLLLSHIAPPLPLPGMESAFLGNAPSIYSGPIRVGADGDFVSLRAGTKDIVHSRRF